VNAPFVVVRPQTPDEVPSPGASFVDVAVLDMNHGWENAGHDSIVALVRRLATDFAPALESAGAIVRLVSCDVRRRLVLPRPAKGPALFIGTGGPGHLDPRHNTRDDLEAGLIAESSDWEDPLFALFDAIDANDEAMLYAVCHSFGLLCRWSGVAAPVERTQAKGGASVGIVRNVLTAEALEHPWFSRLARHLPDRRHFPVADSRHYDLIPHRKRLPLGATAIAYEVEGAFGAPGEALTTCEFARGRSGMPRILGVNHHPEIPDAAELAVLLERKLASGEVTQDWYASRAALLQTLQRGDHSEPARLLAAGYSFSFLVRDGLRHLIEARDRNRGRAFPSAL